MKKIILIVATVLLTVACSKDEDIPPYHNPFPFPSFLMVGNSWTYDLIIGGEHPTDEYTLSIVNKKDTIIDFINYFAYYYHYSEGNNWVLFLATDETVLDGDYEVSLFWKNYTVGKKWEKDFSHIAAGPRKIERKVISINETVTVPAGTFNNCIKIKNTEYFDVGGEELSSQVSYFWVRNDIGIIKEEKGEGTWRSELKSFYVMMPD